MVALGSGRTTSGRAPCTRVCGRRARIRPRRRRTPSRGVRGWVGWRESCPARRRATSPSCPGWRRPPPRPPPRARGGAPQLPSRGRLRGTGRARARARWTRGASSSDGAAMRTVRACRSASKRAARSFRGGNVHLEASCTSRRFASFARRRPRNQARHVCTTSKTPSSITSDSAVVSITHVTPQKRTDNAARSWQTRAAIRHDATRGHASRGSAAASLRVVGMVRSSRARAQPRRLPVCSCCFSSRCTTCCNSR